VKKNLDEEIENLEITIIVLEHQGKQYICEITHELYITGIDGKVLQHMQNKTAMSRCGVCQCTPMEMSKISNIGSELFQADPLALLHGASHLHSMIQSFNFLKNIGCKKISVSPKWIVKNEYAKEKVEKRKEKIQQQFLEKLDLRVDFVNPKGGTSTTGNVCRKAFANHQITAEILNIDEKLVENFKIILYLIASKKEIRIQELRTLCSDTYRLLLTKYPWVLVSPTVHKILAHSADIVESLPLPLGMFGEEGGESRNKIYRKDREHHSRQFSRLASLTDVFNRAMDSSDPYLNHIAPPSKFKNSEDEDASNSLKKYLYEKEDIQDFYQEYQSCDEEEIEEEELY
jgi:hypothetical protein